MSSKTVYGVLVIWFNVFLDGKKSTEKVKKVVWEINLWQEFNENIDSILMFV